MTPKSEFHLQVMPTVVWKSIGESIHRHRHLFCSFSFHFRNITRKTRESPILAPAGNQDGSHSYSCTGESFILFFRLEIMALIQLNDNKSSGGQCFQTIYQGTQTGPFMQPSFLANPVDDRQSSLRKERQKNTDGNSLQVPRLALNFVSRAPTSALLVNCCVF